jgi:hypothetical protein
LFGVSLKLTPQEMILWNLDQDYDMVIRVGQGQLDQRPRFTGAYFRG